MVQKYRAGGLNVALGRCKVTYVEGRCAGGGSEINSGLYHRTPESVVDKWRHRFQIDDLSMENLEPLFLENERDLSVSYLPGPAPPASLALKAGAEALGWDAMEVPRWYRYDAVSGEGLADESPTNVGCRQSMTETFIPRALAAGAKLVPNSRIHRLERCRNGWQLNTQQGQIVHADTVFLAAGAIGTPLLLRRSGFKRNVGNTLRLHPTVKVLAVFNRKVNHAAMGVPVHQVKGFDGDYSFGCSISSPPYLAMAMMDHPEYLHTIGHDWENMAIYYAMSTDGIGSIRPIPGYRDPFVRYQLNIAARVKLADGLRDLCRALFAAGAVSLYPSITGWGPLTDPSELSALPRPLPAARTNLMTVHVMGSCPMGETQNSTAVDSFGKVHGEKNLYINDASILGGAPGVNPQGTVMALARRNALHYTHAT